MTARNTLRRKTVHILSVALGASLLLGASALAPNTKSVAQAENYHSGVVLRKGSSRAKAHNANRNRLFIERRRSIEARNNRIAFESAARRGNSASAGVLLSGSGRNDFVSRRYHRGYKNDSNRLFIERRRSIEARNERIAIQNAERRARNQNSGAGVIVLGDDRQGILTADNGGVAGTVYTQTAPCPRSHNCGYRIYDNGTGPRIITLGVEQGGDLPAFDGLSGPQIITLD